jgi:hypothetical protein
VTSLPAPQAHPGVSASDDRFPSSPLAPAPGPRPAPSTGDRNTAYPDIEWSAGRPDLHQIAAVTRGCALVELLVGGWLAASPWIVGYGGSSLLRWNNLVVGVVLALVGLVRIVRPLLPQAPAGVFAIGAWTIVAAFVLSFQNGATGTAPLWNAIGCGAVLTAAAAWSSAGYERASLRTP